MAEPCDVVAPGPWPCGCSSFRKLVLANAAGSRWSRGRDDSCSLAHGENRHTGKEPETIDGHLRFLVHVHGGMMQTLSLHVRRRRAVRFAAWAVEQRFHSKEILHDGTELALVVDQNLGRPCHVVTNNGQLLEETAWLWCSLGSRKKPTCR